MLKKVLGFFILSGFSSILTGQSGFVNLQVNTPEQVEAGQSFPVEIVIEKGALESFARFQQLLPTGLTASPESSASADFSFRDQLVKLFWFKLPSREQITLRYNIEVFERLKGRFELIGRFSYIDNNQRKSLNISTQPIEILPNPEIDSTLIVDINDYQPEYMEVAMASQTGSDVVCIRQDPYYSDDEQAYIINLLIHKGSSTEYAKIMEQVPKGFRAEPLEVRNARFSFKNKTAAFLWMKLPEEPFFVVSYKLVPEEKGTTLPADQLKGAYSYIQDDDSRIVDIVQRDIDLAGATDEQLQNYISYMDRSGIPEDMQTGKEEEIKPDNQTTHEEITTTIVKDPVVSKPSGKGVFYKVQIMAAHKLVDVNSFFRKYNIIEPIDVEEDEGWYKYTVKKFATYRQARSYVYELLSQSDIKNAFVVAYDGGERIHIREALRLTGQKIY